MKHHALRKTAFAAMFLCAVLAICRNETFAQVTAAEDGLSTPREVEPGSTFQSLLDSVFGSPPRAGGTSVQGTPAISPPQKTGHTWVTIVCGMPGDEEHRTRMTDAIKKIAESVPIVLGSSAERTRVLAGDSQMAQDLSDVSDDKRIADAETFSGIIKEVTQTVGPDDTHWLFVLGHGNLYGKRCLWNVEGPDIDQNEFGEIVKSIKCRRSIVWLLQPASGYWLRPMAAANTISISATEAANEVTATEMPYALADLLSGQSQFQSLEDIDEDGHLTLLDLYLATCIEVTARFDAEGFLQTEHAQLDDNGDGRGKELQQDFLPEAPESRFSLRNNPLRPGSDGAKAKAIPVYALKQPSPPSDAKQAIAPDASETDDSNGDT